MILGTSGSRIRWAHQSRVAVPAIVARGHERRRGSTPRRDSMPVAADVHQVGTGPTPPGSACKPRPSGRVLHHGGPMLTHVGRLCGSAGRHAGRGPPGGRSACSLPSPVADHMAFITPARADRSTSSGTGAEVRPEHLEDDAVLVQVRSAHLRYSRIDRQRPRRRPQARCPSGNGVMWALSPTPPRQRPTERTPGPGWK